MLIVVVDCCLCPRHRCRRRCLSQSCCAATAPALLPHFPLPLSCHCRCHCHRRAATAALALPTPPPHCTLSLHCYHAAFAALPAPPLHCRCQHCAEGTITKLLANAAAAALLPPPLHCRHRCRRRCTSTAAAKLKESCCRRCAAASLPATLPPICHCHRQKAAATINALPPRGASKRTERGREDNAAVGNGRLILTSLNYDSGGLTLQYW